MSSRFHKSACAAIALAAVVVLPVRAMAQMDDDNDPQRVERLENQVRQLTGQNEELQHRNRLLEEQLRQLQGGQGAPQAGRPGAGNPSYPPQQQTYQDQPPQQGYPQQG